MIRKLMVLGVLMALVSVTTFASAEEVFTTPNGTKYHKEDCRLIKNKESMTKIDKDQAGKEGYGPCKKCFAEDITAASSEDSAKSATAQLKGKNKKAKSN